MLITHWSIFKTLIACVYLRRRNTESKWVYLIDIHLRPLLILLRFFTWPFGRGCVHSCQPKLTQCRVSRKVDAALLQATSNPPHGDLPIKRKTAPDRGWMHTNTFVDGGSSFNQYSGMAFSAHKVFREKKNTLVCILFAHRHGLCAQVYLKNRWADLRKSHVKEP